MAERMWSRNGFRFTLTQGNAFVPFDNCAAKPMFLHSSALPSRWIAAESAAGRAADDRCTGDARVALNYGTECDELF
jgi:hypothetical protein